MLPDAEALCAKLVAEIKPFVKPSTAMIGLYTGGAWLAEKLHPRLGLSTPLGLMDIAFYRDDYHKQGLHHDPKRTRIGFEVEGRPSEFAARLALYKAGRPFVAPAPAVAPH